MKVEDAVIVEPVGEFELKRIRRQLAAYSVVAPLASPMARVTGPLLWMTLPHTIVM